MLCCRPQPWTDVESKQLYWEQLTGQVAEKQNLGELGKKIDDQQQRKHFESWESYWGRPGNGAPRNIAHKENLIKMLHFPPASEKVRMENIVRNVTSQPNINQS